MNVVRGVFRRLVRPREKTAVFILGCQRSGTTMLLEVFRRCPEVAAFGEGNRKVMREEGRRLRGDATIREVISRSGKKVLAFKPLNDSQHADRMLEIHPRSRVVWMYRSYTDTINSMLRKWGPHQRDIIDWVRSQADPVNHVPRGEELAYSTYAERMTAETLVTIREVASDGVTDAEGAALVWYSRNQLFFDRGLDGNPDALLLRYEALVSDPPSGVRLLRELVGCALQDEHADHIVPSSVGKEVEPELRPEIRALCDDMTARLDRASPAGAWPSSEEASA